MCFSEDVRIGVIGTKASDLSCVWRLMSFFSSIGIFWFSFSCEISWCIERKILLLEVA